MKRQLSVALAAALLVADAAAASAAGMQASSAETKMAPPASDTLNLTAAQRKTVWHDLYTKSLAQTAPAGFAAKVGAVLPKSITTAPMTTKAAGDVPALRPYDFAMIKGKLLIVNPSDSKIAEVISG